MTNTLVRQGVKRPETLGLGALVLAGALLAAVGTRILTGPLAILASRSLPRASLRSSWWQRWAPRRRDGRSPRTGCSSPACCGLRCSTWRRCSLCCRRRLSTLPSRFAVAPSSTGTSTTTSRLHRLRPQFQRAFVYAASPRCSRCDRLSARLRGHVPGRQVPNRDARPRRDPVLHVVPGPHARVAVASCPTTSSSRTITTSARRPPRGANIMDNDNSSTRPPP